MIRTLAPLFGCGLMMLVCMAMMSMAGRRNRTPTDATTTPASSEEISALRDEVARLRRIDQELRATPDAAP